MFLSNNVRNVMFQADNVRNVQESLDKVLTELDHARTQVEEDFCRSQAEELKLRCDEMMVVLKVTYTHRTLTTQVHSHKVTHTHTGHSQHRYTLTR